MGYVIAIAFVFYFLGVTQLIMGLIPASKRPVWTKFRFAWAKEESDTKVGEERPWSDLQEELLVLITRYLAMSDCKNASTVCKNWWSILSPLVKQPWLMVHQAKNVTFDFSNPLHNKKFIWSQLLDSKIHFSNHGWSLCSRSTTCDLFFFSPITWATKEGRLPPLPNQCFSASFSSPPTSSECKVVALKSTDAGQGLQIYSCNLGDKDWTSRYFYYTSASVPVCHPSVHSIAIPFLDQKKVGIIDPITNTWMVLRKPEGTFDERNLNYVTEFEGEVFMLSFGLPSQSVHLFRLDCDQSVMEEITSLGHRNAYIDPRRMVMATATVRGMENRIYFPETWKIGGFNQLCYYSMETRKYYPGGKSIFLGNNYRPEIKVKNPGNFLWII